MIIFNFRGERNLATGAQVKVDGTTVPARMLGLPGFVVLAAADLRR
jgi:hypothetical protein